MGWLEELVGYVGLGDERRPEPPVAKNVPPGLIMSMDVDYEPAGAQPLATEDGGGQLEIGPAQMEGQPPAMAGELDLSDAAIEFDDADIDFDDANAGPEAPAPEVHKPLPPGTSAGDWSQPRRDEELLNRYGAQVNDTIEVPELLRDAYDVANPLLRRTSPLEALSVGLPGGGYMLAEAAQREPVADATVPELPTDLSPEAAGQGFAQSMNLDWTDEAVGAANFAGGGEYVEGRDIARDRERASIVGQPSSYRFGRAMGTLPHLLLPSVAAEGAGANILSRAAPAIAEGYGFGAAAGGGASTADLTEGEVGDFAIDVHGAGSAGALPSALSVGAGAAGQRIRPRAAREVPYRRAMATTNRARNETRGATEDQFERYLGADPEAGLEEFDRVARRTRAERRQLGIRHLGRDAIPIIRQAGAEMESIARRADEIIETRQPNQHPPGAVAGTADTGVRDTPLRRGTEEIQVARRQDIISTQPGRPNARRRRAEQETIDEVAGPRAPRHEGVYQGFNSDTAEIALRQRATELRATGLAEDANRADVIDAFSEMYVTTPERIGIEEAWQRTMLPELRAAYQRHTGAEAVDDQALFEVRRVLSQELDRAIARVDPALAQRWNRARETYRVGLPAAQIGARQIRNPEGLGRYEAYGIAQSPNPVAGLGRAAAVRSAERRAHAVSAGWHETIASAWQGAPGLMERFGATIRPALGGRPEAVTAAHFVLWERDPEYRRLMRPLLEGAEEDE